MSNIYYLQGQANKNFQADDPHVIGTDIDGVLVECGFHDAATFAADWGLRKPMLAMDGVHYSESGDAVLVAKGEQVNDINLVAEALNWPGFDECGLDAEDYLRTIGRVF